MHVVNMLCLLYILYIICTTGFQLDARVMHIIIVPPIHASCN